MVQHKTLLATAAGVILGVATSGVLVNLSSDVLSEDRVELPQEQNNGISLDPMIAAYFEAKYAGIPEGELFDCLEPLYEEMRKLLAADVEQRISECEFSDMLPGTSPASLGLSNGSTLAGMRILESSGLQRYVTVPEGYDAELDLLRLEYHWLSGRCDPRMSPQ